MPFIPLMIHTCICTPVAVVGLERTFYQIPEDVGMVEVCVIVYNSTGNVPCPINFKFNVNLSSSSGEIFSKSESIAGDEHYYTTVEKL